jgi:hypothetical protein
VSLQGTVANQSASSNVAVDSYLQALVVAHLCDILSRCENARNGNTYIGGLIYDCLNLTVNVCLNREVKL